MVYNVPWSRHSTIQVLWVAEVHSVNIQVSRIPKRKKKSRIIWSTDRDVICSGVWWCVICPQTTNSSNSAPKGQHTWWKPHPEAKKIATLFLLKHIIFLKICVYSLEQSKLEKKHTHTSSIVFILHFKRFHSLSFCGWILFFFFFFVLRCGKRELKKKKGRVMSDSLLSPLLCSGRRERGGEERKGLSVIFCLESRIQGKLMNSSEKFIKGTKTIGTKAFGCPGRQFIN